MYIRECSQGELRCDAELKTNTTLLLRHHYSDLRVYRVGARPVESVPVESLAHTHTHTHGTHLQRLSGE